jgi:hypothetical protein
MTFENPLVDITLEEPVITCRQWGTIYLHDYDMKISFRTKQIKGVGVGDADQLKTTNWYHAIMLQVLLKDVHRAWEKYDEIIFACKMFMKSNGDLAKFVHNNWLRPPSELLAKGILVAYGSGSSRRYHVVKALAQKALETGYFEAKA